MSDWAKLSPRERERAALALVAEGLTRKEAAERLGTSRHAISGAVFRARHPTALSAAGEDRPRAAARGLRRGAVRKLAPHEERRLRDLWADGAMAKHIARELNLTYWQVRHRAAALGLPVRARPRMMDTQIIALYLPEREASALRAKAWRRGVTLAHLTREVIAAYLNSEENERE